MGQAYYEGSKVNKLYLGNKLVNDIRLGNKKNQLFILVIN